MLPEVIEQCNFDGVAVFYEWVSTPEMTAREWADKTILSGRVAIWIIKPKPHVATN